MKNITKFLTLGFFLLANQGTNGLFAQNSSQNAGTEILQTSQNVSIVNTIEPNNLLVNQALMAVVKAINEKNLNPLLPYLLPETKAANIDGAMLQPVLKQVFIQYPSTVETVNITKIQTENTSTRVESTFKLANGTEKQHSFLIDEAGKLLEINVLKGASFMKTGENLNADGKNLMPTMLSSPFEVKKNLIFVEATVNGRKGKFIVDSGSPVLLLNKQYFDDLTKGDNNKVLGGISGAGGQIVGTSYAVANEFLWQNMTLKDVRCLAIDLAHLEKSNKCEILGLIGYNILTHYQTTYDYQENVLTLHKADAENLPKPTGKLLYQGDFEMAAHLAVVKATIGNQTLKFGIDCGASSALIGTSQYQTIKEYTKEKGTDDLRGADQKVKVVPVIKIKELKIGELTFKNMKAVVTDIENLNQGTDKKIDGLLGYDFLKKYKTVINYKTKQISFYE
jgi:predicted aspartyl protease